MCFWASGLAFRVEVWAQLGSFIFTGVCVGELVFGTLSAVGGKLIKPTADPSNKQTNKQTTP